MPKKVKTTDMPMTNENLALNGIEYFNKKAAIKELDDQCKKLRKPLEEAVASLGRVSESGSRLFVVSHADVDVHIKQTLRMGKVLLPEAFDVLRENGLEECIENIPTIREDVLENLIATGKCPADVVKKVYKEKPSYAFSVDLKDRMKDEPE